MHEPRAVGADEHVRPSHEPELLLEAQGPQIHDLVRHGVALLENVGQRRFVSEDAACEFLELAVLQTTDDSERLDDCSDDSDDSDDDETD